MNTKQASEKCDNAKARAALTALIAKRIKQQLQLQQLVNATVTKALRAALAAQHKSVKH